MDLDAKPTGRKWKPEYRTSNHRLVQRVALTDVDRLTMQAAYKYVWRSKEKLDLEHLEAYEYA